MVPGDDKGRITFRVWVPGSVLQYDLAVEVDYPSESFRGRVAISGLSGPAPLELDSTDLTIESVRWKDAATAFELDSKRGKLVLRSAVVPSEPLTVVFSGKVVRGIQTGFFVSGRGERKVLTTQMEPEGCRRFFPCVDRPNAKAVFRLQVTTQPELQVISNTEAESRLLPDGRREWRFSPTPQMSSYLLYLGIGRLEEVEMDEHGTRIIVAAAPGSRAKATNAAKEAAAAVHGYGEYYGLPYPLPKLHLVAIPDFWGAMENWGAISGSDDALLFDETTSPESRRLAQAAIAHEVAHQWFGDLVTMESWNDLWLNEAFATFAVPMVQERTRLREDPWAEFVGQTRRGDINDALMATHAVMPPSIDSVQIQTLIDEVTYQKGSRLIRMIEGYLGEESFRKGISEYLRRHQYANASSQDLWRALESVSGRSVATVMRTWVERQGHPCVRVSQEGPRLRLEQDRFLYLPRDAPSDPWPIPLRLEIDGVQQTVLFDSPSVAYPMREGASFRIDPDRRGFFRVLLEPRLRERMWANAMAHSPLDRWGMLHDAEGFLLSGDYTLAEYNRTLLEVRSAAEPVTSREGLESIRFLRRLLWDEPTFCETARRFCRAVLDRCPTEPQGRGVESIAILREYASAALASVDEAFGRSLVGRFDTIDQEEPALRWAITAASAQYGPPEAVGRLVERARSEDPDAAFLTCVAFEVLRGPESVRRVLDGILDARMRHFLVYFSLRSLAVNPDGRAPVWDWLQKNARTLERRFEGAPDLSHLFSEAIPVLGLGREAEVRAFFAREKFPSGEAGIGRGLENLEVFSRLRSRLAASGQAQ